MKMSINLLGAILANAALAYLLGSVSFAVIVSYFVAHEDVRNYGSKNAGMTNVLRNYGKLPAFFTLLGDFSKGILAVLLGRWIFTALGIHGVDGGYVAGFFALLGHLFPLYFHFKGGKGVLTALGIMLILNPLVFVILVVGLLPVILITRIVSLGSIMGAILFPFVSLIVDLCRQKTAGFDFFFALLFSLIVLYKHRENIKRLCNGTEKRFGEKKTDHQKPIQ